MSKEEKPAEQDFPEIDRLVHEPARFRIMAHLFVVENADFLFLERKTGLTRGNLSSHLGKLEAGGYVDISKEFVEKIPRTLLQLSKKGRAAFIDYRLMMMKVLGEFED